MAHADARPFGIWTATALVVGGMIGAGIFVLPAQLAPYGWTGAIAWPIAVAGSLLIATLLARLTTAMPEETGMVAICGRALGSLAGVLFGWSYWVSAWCASAVIALASIRYLAEFIPALNATPLALAVSSTAMLWLLTLLNLAGARVAGEFQVVTTVLKLLPLIAVVAIVLGLVATGGHAHAPTPPAFVAHDLSAALTLAFYPLIGFECASIAAERVRDPGRNIPRATLAGLIATGALYLLVSIGIDFALPADQVANASAPVALFVQAYWGPAAGLMIAAFAVIATVGCLNCWVLVQGELPLGMARAGLLPAWIGRTNRRDVPVTMLLLSSGLASLLLLSNASRSTSGLMDFMLRLTSATTIWLYVGAALAAWRLRILRPVALAALAFSAWVMIGSGTEAIVLSLVLMFSALPLYYLRGSRLAAASA